MRRTHLGLSIVFGFGALACAGGGYAILHATSPALGNLSAQTPPESFALAAGEPANYYIAVHDKAASVGNWPMARSAAAFETDTTPQNGSAWQRLALAETRQNGTPTRTALKALYMAYDVAPFPAPADMVWRVEFAAQYWAFMPDAMQTASLTQIKILGEIGPSWAIRNKWCKTLSSAPALQRAACETFDTAP